MVPRPSTAELRTGVSADLAGIRALGEAVLPTTYDPIDPALTRLLLGWWSVDSLADQLERIPHVVAEVDGAIAGVATFGRREDRSVLWKLYVHPDHQGVGMGARLLTAVEELVEDDDLWLEVVDGNDRAVDFYTRHGYVVTGRVLSPPYPDDVWMRKSLR